MAVSAMCGTGVSPVCFFFLFLHFSLCFLFRMKEQPRANPTGPLSGTPSPRETPEDAIALPPRARRIDKRPRSE
jgi:hypothetical protein